LTEGTLGLWLKVNRLPAARTILNASHMCRRSCRNSQANTGESGLVGIETRRSVI